MCDLRVHSCNFGVCKRIERNSVNCVDCQCLLCCLVTRKKGIRKKLILCELFVKVSQLWGAVWLLLLSKHTVWTVCESRSAVGCCLTPTAFQTHCELFVKVDQLWGAVSLLPLSKHTVWTPGLWVLDWLCPHHCTLGTVRPQQVTVCRTLSGTLCRDVIWTSCCKSVTSTCKGDNWYFLVLNFFFFLNLSSLNVFRTAW